MKKITILLILISTILSFGSCISIDDFRPEYQLSRPDDDNNDDDHDDDLDDDADDDLDDDPDDDIDDDIDDDVDDDTDSMI